MFVNYFIVTLLTVIIFWFIAFIFPRFGIVDKPDGVRKIHKGEISLGGGIGLFLSSTIFLYVLFPEYSIGVNHKFEALSVVWFTSIIILAMGFLDDIKPLAASFRLIIQIFSSWLVIILTDIYLRDFGNLFGFGNIYVGDLGIPITIFMVVGVCNAFNMLDGIDGLVGLVAFSASTVVSILAWINGESGVLFLGTAVLLIFLVYNLGLLGRKRKIFLGDSGAMWVGFITAWFLVILSSSGDESIIKPVNALWLVSIPLIDALSTFITRLANRKSIFAGDRTHIHHMMLDAGLTKTKVLLILFSISLISSTTLLFFVFQKIEESFQFFGFLTIWLVYYLIIKYPLSKQEKSDRNSR